MEHSENDPKYMGLNVNKGVTQPPSVNPYLKKRTRRSFSVNEYVDGILSGNITMLSQAVTLVESSKPEHQEIAQAIIEKCLAHSETPFALASQAFLEREKVRPSMLSECIYSKKDTNWLFWSSTHQANVRKEVFWAIKREWKNFR